jgi:hypothetical protein
MIALIHQTLLVCALSATPTVDQVFAKYEQATGLARVKTLVRKGYLSHGSTKAPVEWHSAFPGKWRAASTWPRRGPSVVAFDGKSGWRQEGGAPAVPLSRDEALLESLIQDLRIVSRLKGLFAALSAVRTEQRDGREVHVIVARRQGDADERILQSDPEIVFDAATGLLVQLGPVRFDDYRQAGSVKLAHRISFSGDHMVYFVTEVLENVPLDPGEFKQ